MMKRGLGSARARGTRAAKGAPLHKRVVAMEAKLVIVSGKANKRDVKVKLPTVIGRSRDADLTVAHPMISRRHCELFEADGLVKIRDLGSLNGTYIHGKRIEQEVVLRPNEEFTIGPLTFRIEYEAPESFAGPEPAGEETPEYIPSFMQEPEAPAHPPPLEESPVVEPTLGVVQGESGPSAEAASAGQAEDSLEDQLEFDLAEEVASEASPEIQQTPPAEEALPEAEEVALDQLVEEALAEPQEDSDAAEQTLQAEGELEGEERSDEQIFLDLASDSSLESPPQSEKEAPAEPQPPAPSSSSEPEKQHQPSEDLDEIEDAALREFLKGLQ